MDNQHVELDRVEGRLIEEVDSSKGRGGTYIHSKLFIKLENLTLD